MCIDGPRHFVKHYSSDANFGRAIALYIIKPENLAPNFQKQNKHYFRAGVAGSRETQNIDRSITASGAESRASSLISRASMYARVTTVADPRKTLRATNKLPRTHIRVFTVVDDMLRPSLLIQ